MEKPNNINRMRMVEVKFEEKEKEGAEREYSIKIKHIPNNVPSFTYSLIITTSLLHQFNNDLELKYQNEKKLFQELENAYSNRFNKPPPSISFSFEKEGEEMKMEVKKVHLNQSGNEIIKKSTKIMIQKDEQSRYDYLSKSIQLLTDQIQAKDHQILQLKKNNQIKLMQKDKEKLNENLINLKSFKNLFTLILVILLSFLIFNINELNNKNEELNNNIDVVKNEIDNLNNNIKELKTINNANIYIQNQFLSILRKNEIDVSDIPMEAIEQEINNDNPNAILSKYKIEDGNLIINFNGKKFTLIMKGTGTDFEFNSPYWTTDTLLNEHDLSLKFNQSAKYNTYHTLPISELLIIRRDDLYSHLQLHNRGYPLAHYINSGKTHILTPLGGKGTPLDLAIESQLPNNVKNVAPYWRINACKSDSFGNFGARIGGFFTHTWPDTYGEDSQKYACSAECAGVGINDGSFPPFVFAKKSFGVRKAHDAATLQNGQCMENVLIFGH